MSGKGGKRDISGKSEDYKLGYLAARAIGHLVTSRATTETKEEFFRRIHDGGHDTTDYDEGWYDGIQDMREDESLKKTVKSSRVFEVKFIVATHEDATVSQVHEWITARVMPIRLEPDNPLYDTPAMAIMPPEITETDKYASYSVKVERGMCRVEVIQQDTPYNGPSLRDIIDVAHIKASKLEQDQEGDDIPPKVKH